MSWDCRSTNWLSALLNMHQNQGFILQHYVHQAQQCMPVIPARELEGQGCFISWGLGTVGASMRPCAGKERM